MVIEILVTQVLVFNGKYKADNLKSTNYLISKLQIDHLNLAANYQNC